MNFYEIREDLKRQEYELLIQEMNSYSLKPKCKQNDYERVSRDYFINKSTWIKANK